MDVFCYGTLQLAPVIEAVTGLDLRSAGEPATLAGYARFRVAGEVYPGLVSRDGALTEGTLYRGLGESTVARLDRFEGHLYEREALLVRCADETSQRALVYVIARGRESLLSDEAWDLDDFVSHHLAHFLGAWRGEEAR